MVTDLAYLLSSSLFFRGRQPLQRIMELNEEKREREKSEREKERDYEHSFSLAVYKLFFAKIDML